MCDTSGIVSDVIAGASGSTLPWRQGTAGTFLGKGLSAAGGLFDIYEETGRAKKEAQAIGRRAGQLEFDASLRTEAAREAAERRIGGQKGRIAKAGIKAKGSARQLLEEQIKQDELDLLKIAASRDIAIDEEKRAARRAGLESSRRIAQALSTTASDVFGFGQ